MDGRYNAKNGRAPQTETVLTTSQDKNIENEVELASNSSAPENGIYTKSDLVKGINKSILRNNRNKIIQDSLIGCDTLVLQGGKILKVKVVEINESKVRYRLCEASDKETIFEIFNEKVKIIKYANGENKEFLSDSAPSTNFKRTHYGTFGFISLLLGIILIMFGVYSPIVFLPLLFFVIMSIINWKREDKLSKRFIKAGKTILIVLTFISLFYLFAYFLIWYS